MQVCNYSLRTIYPYVIIQFVPERTSAAMAQSVERILGKDEVTGSIPVSSSIQQKGG